MMTYELARQIEQWVERANPPVRLVYDDTEGGLVVQVQRPEVGKKGGKTGRRTWQETERFPSLLAFAEAKRIGT